MASEQVEKPAAAQSKKRDEAEPESEEPSAAETIKKVDEEGQHQKKHPKIVPGAAAADHLKRLQDDGMYQPGDELDKKAAADTAGGIAHVPHISDIKHSAEHLKDKILHHGHNTDTAGLDSDTAAPPVNGTTKEGEPAPPTEGEPPKTTGVTANSDPSTRGASTTTAATGEPPVKESANGGNTTVEDLPPARGTESHPDEQQTAPTTN